MPFASLLALAFSQYIEDRRISLLHRVYPSTRLSQQYPSGRYLRGCTIRFMLRPAVLASTPDWVEHDNFRRAVSVPCRGKFGPCVTTRTRPQPTYPKGQLIRQPPFRLIDSGLATSHIYQYPSPIFLKGFDPETWRFRIVSRWFFYGIDNIDNLLILVYAFTKTYTSIMEMPSWSGW
jgi:hypothetical protein